MEDVNKVVSALQGKTLSEVTNLSYFLMCDRTGHRRRQEEALLGSVGRWCRCSRCRRERRRTRCCCCTRQGREEGRVGFRRVGHVRDVRLKTATSHSCSCYFLMDEEGFDSVRIHVCAFAEEGYWEGSRAPALISFDVEKTRSFQRSHLCCLDGQRRNGFYGIRSCHQRVSHLRYS